MIDSSSVIVLSATTSSSTGAPLVVDGCAAFEGTLQIDLANKTAGDAGVINVLRVSESKSGSEFRKGKIEISSQSH